MIDRDPDSSRSRNHHRMETPDIKFKDIRTPSRSSWDEDITGTPRQSNSAWDVMTPSISEIEEEPSSSRRKYDKDTPLPTPTHRYNAWANERKSFGIKKTSKILVKEKGILVK